MIEITELFEIVSGNLYRVQTSKDSKLTQVQSLFSFIDYDELRMFQLSYIPGPLQTRGYIRGIFRADIFSTPADVDVKTDLNTAINERVIQVEKTRDSNKKFCFLIHENALHTKVCSQEQMVEQIETIKLISHQAHIEIGIIPLRLNYLNLDVEPPQLSFDLFDKKLLIIQGHPSSINVWDAELIEGYSQYFDKLKAVALFGEYLIAELDRIILVLDM